MVRKAVKQEQDRQSKVLREARQAASHQTNTTTRATAKHQRPTSADVAKTPRKAGGRATKGDKYSNIDKGMNWWNFKIKRMTVGQRYLFIGLVLIIPTLLCFFVGLFIDYLLNQEATIALWGIGIGAITAVMIACQQLRKLVD